MNIEEFKNKVLPTKNKLFRLAYLLLRDKEGAEDALQEVFLKLWMNRHKLHTYKSIDAFALCITKNLCLDLLKQAGKKGKVVDLDLNTGFEDATPDRRYEVSDDIRKVRQLMRELPENQQLILQLFDVDGCTFEEIAQVTGFTINNIRVLLSRARKQVRDRYIKLYSHEME
jgi:RNA polymerase sigma-70 factor (ECF subfamily)